MSYNTSRPQRKERCYYFLYIVCIVISKEQRLLLLFYKKRGIQNSRIYSFFFDLSKELPDGGKIPESESQNPRIPIVFVFLLTKRARAQRGNGF